MNDVYERVLAFIGGTSDESFNDLALAIFGHQYENNPPYAAYCDSRGCRPETVADWRDVPAVPIVAFKEVELCCGAAQRVFLSTGTTQGRESRSRHAVPDLRLYRSSALGGLRRFLLPDVERMPMLSLIPSAADMPDSSLSQMVSWAFDELGSGEHDRYCTAGTPPCFDNACQVLRWSEASGEPLCIFTTTAALIRFFDYAAARRLEFRLPHGSRIMDTGGSKGTPRAMSRKGILRAIWNAFAIPGYFAVNEYGMAELSSQFYDSVIHDRSQGAHRPRTLRAPQWLRTLVLDPQTLSPVENGRSGLLCHFDLANAGSVMAILSEDLGLREEHGLRLCGRAPRAEPRGCSMAAASPAP